MTKIAAIWYPRNIAAKGKTEVVSVEKVDNIKNAFGELLFDKQANALLVGYEGKLYVIEATDRDKRLYTRRSIDYHPLSDMVKA